MIKQAIEKVVSKGDLTYDEAYQVMNEIMNGESSQIQNAAYLAALSTKSTRAETLEEIMGSAVAMREHATQVEHEGIDVFEIVGTGGDHANTINISTAAAIVAASAGISVAKHGNRAASSMCGAADCLEALGVNIDQSPEMCSKMLEDVGICFMFAQNYHNSRKYVGSIRKELGIRTVFNILGPLSNPARPKKMLLGVYDELLVEPLAKVLTGIGVEKGMVVYGQNCMDEISLCAPTTVCEFDGGEYKTYEITPEEFGMKRCDPSELAGGEPEENAVEIIQIFQGAKGPKTDVIALNAAAALYINGQAESIAAGVDIARVLMESGAAYRKLNEWRVASFEGYDFDDDDDDE